VADPAGMGDSSREEFDPLGLIGVEPELRGAFSG
jgi:hypothetical protein